MTRDPAALAHLRHELRTPLNHIIGYGEMLLEDGGPAAAKLAPGLRRILDDARRAARPRSTSVLAPGGRRGRRGGPGAAARPSSAAPLERILGRVEA